MISSSQSKAISLIRALAMFSIVACHFLQYYDNRFAWVLNVGVQVFLVLSGYLYGHKVIIGWRQWYVRRAMKIYLPYVLFFAAYATACVACQKATLNVLQVVSYFINIQGIKTFGGVIYPVSVTYGS